MRMRFTLLLVAAALVVGMAAPFAVSAQAPTPGATVNDVTGAVAGGGTFTGTLTNLHFVNQGGVLTAVGNLSGTLSDALGNVIGTVTNVPVAIPLVGATGTCEILDLTLGPLDLNLLGLMVHLDQVHLNITAVSGPGNLLGNLLCAVAHLLDSNASGNALANLLNQILGILGTL